MALFGEKDLGLKEDLTGLQSAGDAQADIESWNHSDVIARQYWKVFKDRPEYRDNERFLAGIFLLIRPFLSVECSREIPSDLRKRAWESMETREYAETEYQLPHRPGVTVHLECSIKSSELDRLSHVLPFELTKSAVIFDVRFQLGRQFTREKYFEAFTEFLADKDTENAKVIKIAYWQHDLEKNKQLSQGENLFALQPYASLLFDTTGHQFEIFAVEARIMSEQEKDDQRAMHAHPASPSELRTLNAIFSGTTEDL